MLPTLEPIAQAPEPRGGVTATTLTWTREGPIPNTLLPRCIYAAPSRLCRSRVLGKVSRSAMQATEKPRNMPCTLAASNQPLRFVQARDVAPTQSTQAGSRQLNPDGDPPTAASRPELLTNCAELDDPSSRSQRASARPSAKCASSKCCASRRHGKSILKLSEIAQRR